MKIRNGFVSNSSSCSFTLVCPKNSFNETVKKLHPYYQQWIKEELNLNESDFCGKRVITIQKRICTEDEQPINFEGKYPKEAEECDYEREDGKPVKKWVQGYDVMDKIVEAVRKNTKDVIYLSEEA